MNKNYHIMKSHAWPCLRPHIFLDTCYITVFFFQVIQLCCFFSVESLQTAAEDPAAGQSGPEPEAEDGQRVVRAVCQGDPDLIHIKDRRSDTSFMIVYLNMSSDFCKLKLFLNFLQNMEDTEKSHNAFLQGAQQELRKEMATLQKKILMDTVSVSEVTPKLKHKSAPNTRGVWLQTLLRSICCSNALRDLDYNVGHHQVLLNDNAHAASPKTPSAEELTPSLIHNL